MTGQRDTQRRYAPIEVTIDGRPYRLRFTWGRLRALRDHTGGRLDVLTEGIRRAEPDDLPLLVWAGITHDREGGDPSLTPEQVRAMVDGADVREVAALDRAVLDGLGIDLDALAELAARVERMAAEAAPDPLPSRTASGTPTSPSGASPSPSSDSASPTSGGSRPGSTPPSGTHSAGTERTGSEEPTTAPR
ncbi:MAG TPA: hypothetical protein VF158_04355 [Longimicrobiales bacterium]